MTHSSPEIALLPCPFCGGSNIESLKQLDFVACQDCGASLEDSEPSARELWNRRAPAQTPCTVHNTVNDRCTRCGETILRVSAVATPQPTPDGETGITAGDFLHNLVDWVYLHATEGQSWPSTTTMQKLIGLARTKPATQADADAMKDASPNQPQPASAAEECARIAESHVGAGGASSGTDGAYSYNEACRDIAKAIRDTAQPAAPTIDSVPSCGEENDYRRATSAAPQPEQMIFAGGGDGSFNEIEPDDDIVRAARALHTSQEQKP